MVVRADLAEDLRHWIADKLALSQEESRRQRKEVPTGFPDGTPVFDVPTGLVRIFDRDPKKAGIAKRDDQGRTLDVLPSRSLDPTHSLSLKRAQSGAISPNSVALTGGNGTRSEGIPDKTNNPSLVRTGVERLAVNCLPDRREDPLTIPVTASSQIGAAGFEPTTSRPPV